MSRSPASPDHSRLGGLDLLRLVAALLVVLFHYTFHGPGFYDLTWVSLPEVSPITKYFNFGVPLFFTISGFVIAYSAEGRTVREFLIARAARLYPGFLICMTLTFVAVALFGGLRLHTTSLQWAANLFIVAPAFKQPYMDPVYWSIAVEVMFYAWVAMAISFGIFERRLPTIAAGWILISFANEQIFNVEAIRRLLITNYSGYFSSGLMLYALFRGQRSTTNCCLLCLATLLGAFQADWNADWLRERGVELSSWIEMSLGGSATAIVGLFVVMRQIPLRPKLVLAVGGLTYPLYLIHQMIGYVIFNHLEGFAPPSVMILGMIIVMIAISWTIYKFIERPAQSRTKVFLSKILNAEQRSPDGLRAH